MKQNTLESLRLRLKTVRNRIPAAQQERDGLRLRARLFTWLAETQDQTREAGGTVPQTVAAYWPLQDEPDLRPLMRQWDNHGIIVALPVMFGAGRPLMFHRWTHDTPMLTAQFGVMEPVTSQPCTPDIILVPTLGFTKEGDRIGYGQGYYDRTLAQLRESGHHPLTIGIAWSEGDIARLDPDYEPMQHDYRLDRILTPDGWVDRPAPTQESWKFSL